jgi:two-component system response regulator CpxR
MAAQSLRSDLERVVGCPECDVLVVEDDDVIRSQLELLLEVEGYSVASAANGEAALAYLEQARVGVVLLDLMMPVMSGWELAAAMRRKPHLASVPVMTITAVSNAHRAPPGPVFLKPLNVDSLLRGISRYLHPPGAPL